LIQSFKVHCKNHSICFFVTNYQIFKKCILHFEEEIEDEEPKLFEFEEETSFEERVNESFDEEGRSQWMRKNQFRRVKNQ
jgi:hypothetical protein